MAVPVWFDVNAYLENKVEQMNMTDTLNVLAAFKAAGWPTDAQGLYDHFVAFGNAEGVSPNGYFDNTEYLHNKAASYYGTSNVTENQAKSMLLAMNQAGMSPWTHYQLFWAEGYAKDGSFNNPSVNFDVAKYMNAKLALMQEADKNYTMDQLVKAFQDAGLDPITHYALAGAAEGLVPAPVTGGTAGSTFELGTGDDSIFGTSGDDFFNAKVGTLGDNDYLDGGAGNDTLYATVKPGDTNAIEPTITNIETLLFRAQNNNAGGANNSGNFSDAYIDAGNIKLANGQMLTLGSDNSRADLSIEDVRHKSNETTIRFSNTDPGDIDFDVYFDPQHLTAESATTSGTLQIELMDVRNAQESNGKTPLLNNPFDKFVFQYTDNAGKEQLVELNLGAVNGDSTYDDLLAAFQAALKAAGWEGIITAEMGPGFTASATVGGTTYTSNVGEYIVLKSADGSVAVKDEAGKVIEGAGWGVSTGVVPPTGGIVWDADNDSNTTCPLIQTNVELDNVGRVLWADAYPECLPDDIIFGSNAGDLTIGSMADRGGIERMDITVDRGSWLSSIQSTNESLRMITVKGADIDGNGVVSNGQLYIGDWDGNGDQLGNGANFAWSDAAQLLTADVGADTSGLIDVAVFDATGYKGDINIAAEITSNSFDKYFKSVDGEEYIDEMYAPLADQAYKGAFSYFTGEGDDVVNMTINGAIAADNDFKMNINTGAGDDLVALRYKDMTTNQSLDQKQLKNVTINTGDGDDTVWFFGDNTDGDGSVVIKTGAGNDVIYANQNEDFTGGSSRTDLPAYNAYNAVFVFNTSEREIGVDGLEGATLNNDMAIGMNTFAVSNPVVGETLIVTVTFKGIEASFVIANVVANMGGISAAQVNHAIISAIENSSDLSNLLSAKDGAGNTLIIESLINGAMSLDDLEIAFGSIKADGTPGTSGLTTDSWYETQFGIDDLGNEYEGMDSTSGQVVVDAGSGNDLIVLGPNGGLRDVIEVSGELGNDTLIGFTADDRINVAGILSADKAVTQVAVGSLTDNAVATHVADAKASNGIFTQAEVNALIPSTIKFAGTTAGTSLVLLRDTNAAGQYVYTLVKMVNGTTPTGTVLGAFVMETDGLVNVELGLDQIIAQKDSVLQSPDGGQTYTAYSNTGKTVFTGTEFSDTFNGLSTANLANSGSAIVTVNAGNGNDVLNVNGAVSSALELNGGLGRDTFNVSTALAAADNLTINGDAGPDTLAIASSVVGNVQFAAVDSVETITVANIGTATFTAITTDTATTLTATAAVTSLIVTSLDASAATTIDGSLAGIVTVDASTSTAAVTLKGGTGVATLTGGDANDTLVTTGTATSTLVGGLGNDTFTLGSTGIDTITFGATLALNGFDTITGFKGGATGDVLNADAFITNAAGAVQLINAGSADVSIGDGTTNNVGVLFNVADGLLDKTKVVATATATFGEVIVDAGVKTIILVTNDADGAGEATYNMYYVTGAANNADVVVELVGTVTADAAFNIANF